MNCFLEALETMKRLYGKDTVMQLATVNKGNANIRTINSYYKNKSFYVITYSLSNKIADISSNPSAALCHNLFVAHGKAENIGHPLNHDNKALRDELKQIFCKFYEKHVSEQDENTCILKIALTDAIVFDNNLKYHIDFINETASKEDFVVDIIF